MHTVELEADADEHLALSGEVTITIRGVDAETWRHFKARAALRGEALGAPATRAFRYLLESE